MFYKTDKFDGEIKSSDEGKVYWIELEKMKTMKLANDMQDMLKIFLNDELSEFYYYKENGDLHYKLKNANYSSYLVN